MKQLDFETNINHDATITIPQKLVDQIDFGRPVRVVILLPDNSDDKDWAELTSKQFLKGYSERDAIYDELSNG